MREEQHEYNNSDQIQRSGTSIGANYSEACDAESRADFVHKLSIAQKECNETLYWLELLLETNYLSDAQFEDIYSEAEEIMRMLTSSIITTRNRIKK